MRIHFIKQGVLNFLARSAICKVFQATSMMDGYHTRPLNQIPCTHMIFWMFGRVTSLWSALSVRWMVSWSDCQSFLIFKDGKLHFHAPISEHLLIYLPPLIFYDISLSLSAEHPFIFSPFFIFSALDIEMKLAECETGWKNVELYIGEHNPPFNRARRWNHCKIHHCTTSTDIV